MLPSTLLTIFLSTLSVHALHTNPRDTKLSRRTSLPTVTCSAKNNREFTDYEIFVKPLVTDSTTPWYFHLLKCLKDAKTKVKIIDDTTKVKINEPVANEDRAKGEYHIKGNIVTNNKGVTWGAKAVEDCIKDTYPGGKGAWKGKCEEVLSSGRYGGSSSQ